jgi:hypothetical protein
MQHTHTPSLPPSLPPHFASVGERAVLNHCIVRECVRGLRTTGNCAAGQVKVKVYGHFWYVMSSSPPPWSSAPKSTKLVKRLAGGWASMAQPCSGKQLSQTAVRRIFPAARPMICNKPVITNIPKTWQPPAATVSIGVGREIPGLLNCRFC